MGEKISLLEFPESELSKVYISSSVEEYQINERFILNRFYDDTRFYDDITSISAINLDLPISDFSLVKEKVILDKALFLPEYILGTLILNLEISLKEKLFVKGKNQTFIVVKDTARFIDSGGTDQDRKISYYEECHFEDSLVKIFKLSFVTWLYYVVEHPYTSFWHYTKIVYFKDAIEFWQFKLKYKEARLSEPCPVCGGEIKAMCYCFFDVDMSGAPLYFCSKECLRTFTGNLRHYRVLYKNYVTSF